MTEHTLRDQSEATDCRLSVLRALIKAANESRRVPPLTVTDGNAYWMIPSGLWAELVRTSQSPLREQSIS